MNRGRPWDAVEAAISWKVAIERKDGPSALIFSRQGLPHQDRDARQLADVEKGAYVLSDCAGTPDVILIARGSEVGLAVDAKQVLSEKGKNVRVVSMPCTEIFDTQSSDYKESVLPSNVRARVAIEAAHQDFWFKYVGMDGAIVGMSTFGESAPAGELFKLFGFTVENVVEKAKSVMGA
jgi:transketolase